MYFKVSVDVGLRIVSKEKQQGPDSKEMGPWLQWYENHIYDTLPGSSQAQPSTVYVMDDGQRDQGPPITNKDQCTPSTVQGAAPGRLNSHATHSSMRRAKPQRYDQGPSRL